MRKTSQTKSSSELRRTWTLSKLNCRTPNKWSLYSLIWWWFQDRFLPPPTHLSSFQNILSNFLNICRRALEIVFYWNFLYFLCKVTRNIAKLPNFSLNMTRRRILLRPGQKRSNGQTPSCKWIFTALKIFMTFSRPFVAVH